MMLRFGVDFLTMKSLTHQQVSDLRGTSTIHWNQILSQEENADHSESESSDSNSELEAQPVGTYDKSAVILCRDPQTPITPSQ